MRLLDDEFFTAFPQTVFINIVNVNPGLQTGCADFLESVADSLFQYHFSGGIEEHKNGVVNIFGHYPDITSLFHGVGKNIIGFSIKDIHLLLLRI